MSTPVPTPVKKQFTHTVQVPAATDVPEMLGAYRSLLTSIQIQVGTLMDLFPENPNGFTHPIPESKAQLEHDFFGTMSLMQSSVLEHGTVYLENVTVSPQTLVFVLFYME